MTERILLAEDDPAITDSVSYSLRACGYHVAAVTSGQSIELTPSEFRILALLAADPGRVFTRAEIANRLARGTSAADDRGCDAHVKNLRRKIEEDPARPRRVVTVRGVGYLLRAV